MIEYKSRRGISRGGFLSSEAKGSNLVIEIQGAKAAARLCPEGDHEMGAARLRAIDTPSSFTVTM